MTIQIKNMQLLNQLHENITNFDKLNENFEVNIDIIIQITIAMLKKSITNHR